MTRPFFLTAMSHRETEQVRARRDVRRISWAVLAGIALLCLSAGAAGEDKLVVGWVEKVRVYPANLLFNAKLDTGARTSSIDARNIEEFERDGELWLRFDVVSRRNKTETIEMRQVREARIKRHFGKEQRRHVVKMGICLADFYKEVEVNLVNREGFIYEMLIGRIFMKQKLLIDPSAQYTTTPRCKNIGPHEQ